MKPTAILAVAAAVGLVVGAAVVTTGTVTVPDPQYVDTWCHWTDIGGYTSLPAIQPTPALPDYQAPRWVGDTHPCGV